MKINKKFVVIVSLAGLATIGTAATTFHPKKAKPEEHFVNLKVLPEDISSKDLQQIMADDFEDGLGVSCGFCHANAKDSHRLDFVSDAKPEKEIARAMMRMTLGINRKYFQIKHPLIGNAGLTINCTTCHKGRAFPDGTDQ
jgi:hypothetical protein